MLGAGTHHTEGFDPGFAFALTGPGWENLEDAQGVFILLSLERPGDAIAFLRQPWPTDAAGKRVPGVATNVDELRGWLVNNPTFAVTEPVEVTVGGLTGSQMDVSIAAEVFDPGPADCPAQVCVNMFIGRGSAWAYDWGFAGPERQRLYLLHAPDTVVAIFVDSLDGATWEKMIDAAEEILPTVAFDGV